MKISICFSLFLVILGNACRNESNSIPVIDTKSDKVEPVNLSVVFKMENQVKLQDTDPLIERIDKVIKTKDFIFVKDLAPDSRLLQFDKNGNFIKRIGREGNGPGEHRGIGDFAIDDENNVYLKTFRKLLSYDSEGNFLNSCPAEHDKYRFFAIENIIYRDNCLWSFQNKALFPDDSNKHDTYICDLVRYDKSLRPIDTTVLLRAYYNVGIFTYTESFFLSDLGDDTYVYIPVRVAEPFLRDTLYELKGLNKKPVLKFDFSAILSVDASADHKIKKSLEGSGTGLKVRNLEIIDMIRTRRYVFIHYWIMNDDFLFCYDLEDQRNYNMSEGFTDDMTGSGSVIKQLMPLDLKTGEFCFVKDGYELEGIMDGVNENSNPVIFFVKTKE